MDLKQSLAGALRRLPYGAWHRLYRLREELYVKRTPPIPDSERFFFIVGSQRSGTTLLGLILDSHPEIRVYDEGDSYRRVQRDDYADRGVLGFKMPVWTHRHSLLRKKFPNSRFIFLQRDIRSVVSSMLSLQQGDLTWIQRYGVVDLAESIALVTHGPTRKTLAGRFAEHRRREEWLELATLCAYVKQGYITEYERLGGATLEVRYEDLVLDPESQARALLDFLSLPWNDTVLHHDRSHSGVTFGGTDRSRPIDAESLRKWKTKLTDEQVTRIEEMVSELDRRLPRGSSGSTPGV